MSETGYGPGGYRYTLAETPSEPVLTRDTSVSILAAMGLDNNSTETVYAIYNETNGEYVNSEGSQCENEVWRTASDWGIVSIKELNPGTEYTFKVKARNSEGVETSFGRSAAFRTNYLSEIEIEANLNVIKASSTISAPAFMSGLSAGIKIAGKDMNELGFYVDKISGLDVPKVIPDEEIVPGDHTWHVWDEYFALKRIVIEGYIHGSSADDLRLRLAYLKSFLATFEGDPWRSTAPVRLERSDLRDRHWVVYYESIDSVETIGKRDISTSARIRLTMKCPMPFAVSNEIVREIFTPLAGTFKIIDLGNAPSDAVYVIKGESVNPSFTVGDMVFHCDFSDGLSFRNEENIKAYGNFSPSEDEAGAYRTTETGIGINISDGNTISYTATGNKTDGSWIVVFYPLNQSTAINDDVVILEHRYDANNYIRIYWDAANDRWVFRKRASGMNNEVYSGAQAFTAGARIILGITYDTSNAGGMKLFIDGMHAATGGDVSVIEGNPTALTFHNNDGTQQPEAVFDMVCGWSRMLSADEMLKIATDPGAVKNLNVGVSYNGVLDANDLLTLDSRLKTAAFFDVSSGTTTNAISGVDGKIPMLVPGRKRKASDRTQTVIYSKTAAALMEVRYGRRYL